MISLCSVKSFVSLYCFYTFIANGCLKERWMCPWGALCGYTPIIQSISRFADSILFTSLSWLSVFLVLPTSFPFQFSVSISGHLYLNYFREILALQHQRQSPIRSEGHFNISKAICKLQNTIKLGRNWGFKLYWTCGWLLTEQWLSFGQYEWTAHTVLNVFSSTHWNVFYNMFGLTCVRMCIFSLAESSHH